MGRNQQKSKLHKNICKRRARRETANVAAVSKGHGWELSEIDVEALRFIREESGRVYRDQVIRHVQEKFREKSEGEIENSIKQCLEKAVDQKWIVVDDTAGIVTIPSKRKGIDEIIGYLKPWENPKAKGRSSSLKLSLSYDTKGTSLECIRLNTETLGIRIQIESGSRVKDFNLDEIYSAVYEKVNEDKILNKRLGELHFESIVAREVSYEGRTTLTVQGKNEHRTWFTGQFDFSRSRFIEEVVLQDIVYIANGASKEIGNSEKEKINFRDCEFEKGVSIRNLSIANSTTGTQITFEDSIIKGNMEVLYSELGHAKLNCLQMIVGQHIYCPEPANIMEIEGLGGKKFVSPSNNNNEKSGLKICLKNLFMYEDAVIDFSHVEISEGGRVEIENVPVLPRVFMNLQTRLSGCSKKGSCPKTVLSLQNCTLYGIMEIGNVSELETKSFINLGRIESAPEDAWGMIEQKGWGDHSNDHLVQAVKNNVLTCVSRNKKGNAGNFFEREEEKRRIFCEGARSFVILKKNYESCGMNDSEDEALIQYMLHHHRFYPRMHEEASESSQDKNRIISNVKRVIGSLFLWMLEMVRALLFRLLHITGGFGTSPLRTVVAMIVVSLLFWLFAFLIPIGDFSLHGFGSAMSKSLTSILPLPNTESYMERVIGTLLIGYFSIAIVRKTMR